VILSNVLETLCIMYGHSVGGSTTELLIDAADSVILILSSALYSRIVSKRLNLS